MVKGRDACHERCTLWTKSLVTKSKVLCYRAPAQPHSLLQRGFWQDNRWSFSSHRDTTEETTRRPGINESGQDCAQLYSSSPQPSSPLPRPSKPCTAGVPGSRGSRLLRPYKVVITQILFTYFTDSGQRWASQRQKVQQARQHPPCQIKQRHQHMLHPLQRLCRAPRWDSTPSITRNIREALDTKTDRWVMAATAPRARLAQQHTHTTIRLSPSPLRCKRSTDPTSGYPASLATSSSCKLSACSRKHFVILNHPAIFSACKWCLQRHVHFFGRVD